MALTLASPGMIVKDRIASELLARPAFSPKSWGIVVPRTALLPSGKYGQFRYYSVRRDAISQPLFLKGCDRLAEYGGYVRIDGVDKSSLFVEVEGKCQTSVVT